MWRKRTITGCPTATAAQNHRQQMAKGGMKQRERSKLKLRFEVPQWVVREGEGGKGSEV